VAQIKTITFPVRFLAAAVLITLISGCNRGNDELRQTLEWMDNTYNPHEGVSLAVGHGRTGWYKHSKDGMTEELVSASNETFTRNGCQFNLHISSKIAPSVPWSDSSTYTFNLHDIDPQSIKIATYSHFGGFRCEGTAPVLQTMGTCDHAEITFTTHNESPLIDFSGSKNTSGFFEVDDVEYATRLANAFRHAVELCGGKPSTF
jgi:hypothetical protein